MQGVNTRPGVDQQFAIDRAPDGVIEASDSSLAHAFPLESDGTTGSGAVW